jgi:hypothetical protein
LAEDFGQINLQAGGLELPFRHQSFASGARLLHVFYCLWSDRRAPDQPALAEDGPWNSRLRAVLTGQRHLGQQVMEIVVQGPDSNDEAVALVRAELPLLIKPD